VQRVVFLGEILAGELKPTDGRAGAAPLAFLALTLLKIRWDISSAVSQAQKAMGGNSAEMQKMFSEMAETAMKQMMDVISIGLGAYVLIAACAVLAFYAVKGKAA
jgi:hypothetical protein